MTEETTYEEMKSERDRIMSSPNKKKIIAGALGCIIEEMGEKIKGLESDGPLKAIKPATGLGIFKNMVKKWGYYPKEPSEDPSLRDMMEREEYYPKNKQGKDI